ncbi:MAG: CheF family chemotaxis protein [Haloferacaceae archaeon]
MSNRDGERILVDFVGEFFVTGTGATEPSSGRILMSSRRLVLAGSDDKTTIPMSSIFDVAVGHVPPEMREFFNDSVTIAYERGDTRRFAVVEAGSDTVDKFTTILFKAQLNGIEATVKHPARRGGRVLDTPTRLGKLRVKRGRMVFAELPSPFEIDLGTVTEISKTSRTLGGKSRPTLEVRHLPSTTSVVTDVILPTQRKMNLLGRYLRLEYSDLMEELEDISLTDEELQVLVGLYSAGEAADPTELVTADPSRTTMVLNSLREKGLVVDGEQETSLTPKGRVVITDRLEDIN